MEIDKEIQHNKYTDDTEHLTKPGLNQVINID